MPITLQEMFGRYRILSKLGEGGMGIVYLADDTRLNRRSPLKIPRFAVNESQQVIDRFYREARLAAAITHRNLCPIYDVDCHEGTHYLTMALIEGTPLTKFLGPDRPWPPAKAMTLICQLASVLQQLHDRGIIHRDLKPGNVMIRPDESPVLMDFGLARSLLASGQHLTTAGKLIGTPAYMAPEQITAEEGSIGPATDVYALGAILYQLLTGELPINGSTPMEILARTLAMEPLPPSLQVSGIDPRLDTVSLRALAKSPAERQPSMKVFAQQLQAIRRPTTIQPVAPPPPPRPQPAEKQPTVKPDHTRKVSIAQRRNWMAVLGVAGGGLVALIAAVVLIVASWGSSRTTSSPLPTIRLHSPPDMVLAPDEQKTISVKLDRQQCNGEVRLVQDGHSEGLRVQPLPFSANSTETEVRIRVLGDAQPGKYVVRLIALGPGDERSETSFAVNVQRGDAARTPSLRFRNVPEVTLAAGQTRSVEVILERNLYEGEIKLLLDGRVDGIDATPESLPASETTTRVTLKATADVTPGKHLLRLVALGSGSLRAEGVIPVRVVSGPHRQFKNSVGMELVLLPAGKFERGSPESEKERDENEGPQRTIQISRPFYMGVYEVTQEEYRQAMGSAPSHFSSTGVGAMGVVGLDTGLFPVDSVSWDDAVEFCNKLNERAEEKKAGRRYRLPTEAEWEYACRGGSTTYRIFHVGDNFTSTDGNCDGSQPYGDAKRGPNLGRTTTVGSYKANAFGLHDMHGNVYEWCSDRYDEKYYERAADKDPQGPDAGQERVLRGGSYLKFADDCRSARRFHLLPNTRNPIAGFRVVCETTEMAP